jgi:SAM-dependent methyltransferase
MSTSEWWQTFFTGVALDMWRAFETPEMNRREADYIEKVLQIPRGGKLLDAPCGNGRLALELASRGLHVTGVDLAQPYIDEGQAKAAQGGLPVVLQRRDMRDLPWQAEFDGAICWGNSFGYLDDQGNADYLRAVARALKPGATLLIDFGPLAEVMVPAYQARRWYELGGIYMLIDNQYDVVHSSLETDYTFIRDGKVERRHGRQRIFTYRELCQLLGDTGFTDCVGHNYLTTEPFKFGGERANFLARRRPDGA